MENTPHSYVFGGFRLDVREKALYSDGRRVILAPKAFDTLLALVERHGRVVAKEDLLQRVWPDAFVEENNLAQNISHLRRVLGEGVGGARFIETLPKRGCSFVADVREVVEEEPRSRPAELAGAEALTSGVTSAIAEHRRPGHLIWAGALLAAIVGALLASPSIRDRVAAFGEEPRPAAVPADPDPAARRIAVLPFANLGSPDDDYVAAGVTEDIHSRLASLSGLALRSSATIAAYDRRGKDVHRIGADLDVDYLIEGSVRWERPASSELVRISSRLIRVADDTTIWGQQYDASPASLASVQSDIAYRIADALRVALDARERRAVGAPTTTDADAYLAYLRGLAAYQDGFSDTTNQAQARTELEHAVARDPRFALAWSWLARTYISQYRSGADRTRETRDAAFRAAETAIAIDGALPEGHLALANAYYAERRYADARRELEIARVGLPNSTELWQLVGNIDQAEGRWREARAALMRAFELDPPAAAQWVTVHYLHLRDYPEARRFIGLARAANKRASVVPEAWLRFSEGGEVAEARPLLEAALESRPLADARVRGLLARLEWFDGRHQRALELIEAMDPIGAWMAANFRYPAAVAAGQVYETMGRHQDALRHNARALPDLLHRERRSPDDYQVHAGLALAYLGLRQSANALRHAERATTLLPVSRDAVEGPLYLYLLAQVQAQTGNEAVAFATLDRLFGAPAFYNEHWVQRDPAFASLRRQRSFPDRVARWSTERGDALLAASSR